MNALSDVAGVAASSVIGSVASTQRGISGR